jgi:hypothetical protein
MGLTESGDRYLRDATVHAWEKRSAGGETFRDEDTLDGNSAAR